ncbi:hypothetical protein G9A89_016021 [Geosiphon pyriformis]|nr:hypothetical protein G9A89_016021 [Geosiphon pyriformis]
MLAKALILLNCSLISLLHSRSILGVVLMYSLDKTTLSLGERLSLAASGLFSSPLAGSFSPVKVLAKKLTWVSSSVISTASKSPKIFNNKPVNKLVFSAFTTSTTTTTTTTTTASQMAVKAKNSKKQQQTVTTAMVTPNPFVVPDKIFVAKQPIISDDLKDWTDQMEMESTAFPPISGAANSGA